MEIKELFDLLERCSSLSIRGNTKAIQQATALLARIQELETVGREADELIQYYIVRDKRIYSELNSEEKKSIRNLAALLNNTPLEKE